MKGNVASRRVDSRGGGGGVAVFVELVESRRRRLLGTRRLIYVRVRVLSFFYSKFPISNRFAKEDGETG